MSEQLAHLNCPKLLLSDTVPPKVEAAIKDIFSDLTVLNHLFSEKISLSMCVNVEQNFMMI